MSNSSKYTVGWAAFFLAVCLLGSLPASSQDSERPPELTPAEMLEDGLDAITDRAPGAARNVLEELISSYPGSAEAAKARKALGKLEAGPESAYERAVIREDEVERLQGFRRAFLHDAGDRVFFSENSASVGGRARIIIENQARWLKSRPSLRVDIIGRADDGGSRQQEIDLAKQRAEAIRERLVAGGVDGQRLRLRIVGASEPVAVCMTPLCRAENRNVELLLSALDDDTPDTSAIDQLPRKGADLDATPTVLGDITSR